VSDRDRFALRREHLLPENAQRAIELFKAAGLEVTSPEARAASLAETLEGVAPDRDVWVFGYGSLMWNPAFHFAERRAARVHGYHRQFCLWARAGRGSPARPGLMLALETGGSCHGVAYRLHRDKVRSELDVVWRREMLTMAYRPVWVSARTAAGIERAIAFAANRSHERYVRGLEPGAVVGYLASGAGPLGRCRDYLLDTVRHLRDLGIRDRRLEALAQAVEAREADEFAA